MTSRKILILGDHTEQTSKIYQKFCLPPSELILSLDQDYQIGHTSPQDITNLEELAAVLQQADVVFWGDPKIENFSSKESFYDFVDWVKQYQYQFRNIANFDEIKFDPYRWRPVQTKTDPDDLIALGCSLTFGVGLTDASKTWSSLVANKLGLKERNLGQPGGSLQKVFGIFNSLDLYPNQTVILQVPPLPRLQYVTDRNVLQDVILSDHNSSDELLAVFNERYLFYNCFQIVLSMVRRCREKKCKFIFFLFDYKNSKCCLHEDQMYFYDLPELIPKLSVQNYNLDVGTDNMHPGTKSHEFLAQKVIEHFDNIYDRKR